MTGEEEFLNALKDRWTGRKYQFQNIEYVIIDDHVDYVTYSIIHTNDGCQKTFFRGTRSKRSLEEHLRDSGYVRTK